jgi:hypothetical protein
MSNDIKRRKWRPKMENPIDPPMGGYENYNSYQKIINSNNGQIDQNLLDDHINFILNGEDEWEEIPVDFSILNNGERIRYTTRGPKGERLFRTGGWVCAIDEIGAWLAYHSHTHTNWTLQSEDCQRLFVTRKKNAKRESKIPKEYIFNVPGPLTDHTSYLTTSEGKIERVFSGKDVWALNRFESSKKYQRSSSGEVPWRFKES